MGALPTVDDLADYQAKDPQQALDAALTAVQSFCGWHIAPSQAGVATVWSRDGHTLILPTLYLTAVASVVQDEVPVDPANYTFEQYGVIRLNYGGQFWRYTRVTVNFTHGYATMPDDAAGVVLSLAQRSITDTRGFVARQGATGSSGLSLVETYGPQFSDADKEKLKPYTRPGLG